MGGDNKEAEVDDPVLEHKSSSSLFLDNSSSLICRRTQCSIKWLSEWRRDKDRQVATIVAGSHCGLDGSP